jgi:hypothetical protein
MEMFVLADTKVGPWSFQKIETEDIHMYAEFIQASEYPGNLWSSNFAYLWASSLSKLRRILWKIVDDMLVTFGYSYKNSLYLYCLPMGKGDPDKLTAVTGKCLQYCYEWNHHESNRSMIRMINHQQLEFLQNCPDFDRLYRKVTLQGIERHLDLKKLVSLRGKDFSTLRNKINKFHREHPQAAIRRYQERDFDPLMTLQKHWTGVAGKKYANIFDTVYYREIIKHFAELEQTILVMEEGRQIIGMVAGGETPAGQAWGSLLKYEEGLPGLSEVLSIEFAREMHRINPRIEFLNVGSDLGAGGLRDYKLKFRPVLNLKRYQIYLK